MSNKLKLFACTVSCALLLFNCNISASGDQTPERRALAAAAAAAARGHGGDDREAAAGGGGAAAGGGGAAGPLTFSGEIYDSLDTRQINPLPGAIIKFIMEYARTVFPIAQYSPDDFCKGVAAEILGYKGDRTEVTVILQPRCSHSTILRALKSYKRTLTSLKLTGLFDGIATEESQRSLFKVLWAQVNDVLVMKLPNLRKLTFNVPFYLEEIALEICVSRVFKRSKRVVDGQTEFTFEKQYLAAAASKEDMSAAAGGKQGAQGSSSSTDDSGAAAGGKKGYQGSPSSTDDSEAAAGGKKGYQGSPSSTDDSGAAAGGKKGYQGSSSSTDDSGAAAGAGAARDSSAGVASVHAQNGNTEIANDVDAYPDVVSDDGEEEETLIRTDTGGDANPLGDSL